MSCDYCQKNVPIFHSEKVDTYLLGWGNYTITSDDISYSDYGLFLERGYLRFTDLDDTQCLDHGEKIKIKFCPFCGKEL